MAAKKDNHEKRTASTEQRLAAHEIRAAREYAKRWKVIADERADTLKAEMGPDVILQTEDEVEVAVNTESISTPFDYERFFNDHPAEKALLEKSYRKPASTKQTLTTSWVEPNKP